MKIGVFGIGLIGGSLSIQARKYFTDSKIYGFDLNDITECYYGLIVADIDKEYIIPRYGNDEMEVHDVILQYDDVIKIGLADDNYKEVLSRDYSWYTWKDQYEAYKKHFV